MLIRQFCSTLTIPGWLSPAEAEWLTCTVAEHPAGGVCVDCGSYAGRSAACLAYGCKVRDDGSRVVSVDPYERDNVLIASGNVTPADFWRNLRALGLAEYVTQYVERSPAGADHVADSSACLVFLDAAHDRASVASDLAAWVPKLLPGGVLALHDYAPGLDWTDVRAVAHETFGAGALHELEPPSVTGLGWWIKPQGE
jgi:predicted O-methyltransferase YrrM